MNLAGTEPRPYPPVTPSPSYRKLPRSFYLRPTLRVARDLLGKYLIRNMPGRTLTGRIVEVEAYLGEKDPASHAYRGRTGRNEAMFFEGGHLYVYFTYGMHYCCNVVTEREGLGRAVLIRALEPVAGIDIMTRHREKTAGTVDPANLANGPAKLCQAMDISGRENGTDLLGDTLFIARTAGRPRPGGPPGPESERIRPHGPFRTQSSERIGIRRGKEKKWRFFIANSPFVSR